MRQARRILSGSVRSPPIAQQASPAVQELSRLPESCTSKCSRGLQPAFHTFDIVERGLKPATTFLKRRSFVAQSFKVIAAATLAVVVVGAWAPSSAQWFKYPSAG